MSIIESFISHQVYVSRLASGMASDNVSFLEKMRKIVRDEVLKAGDDSRSAAKLRALLKTINEQLYAVTGDLHEKWLADMQEFSLYETDWTAKTLNNQTPKGVSFIAPSPEQAWSAATQTPLSLNSKPVDFKRWLKGWQDTEVDRLVMGVKSGFFQGQTTRQIVKNVVGTGGLADVSQRDAATLVRTAINHLSTTAKDAVYERNSDIVIGYELVVTLDSRTSPICKNWPPNKVYKPTDSYRPKPPFHANCRTTSAPVLSPEFDYLDSGAKRAAKGAGGGQEISASTSYYQFLKKQPAWFQDDALGATRGKIFRNAGLTGEEFRRASVDGLNNPLTLREMADKDKRIAKYLKELRDE